MFIVPYFVDTTNANWTKLGLFLCEGGRSVWSTDSTDAEINEMLVENGFPVLNLRRAGDTIYAKIDHKSINFKNFYIWTEINPKTSTEDVWRFFQIPNGLWTCPVFRENYWKSANLPIAVNTLIEV